MPQKNLNLFITSVHFRGFKSLKDLRVTGIKKGLNILIGKNASGKSNFLECLFHATEPSPRNESRNLYKFGEIEFISSDNDIIKWESEKEAQKQNDLFFDKKQYSQLADYLEDRIYLKEKLFVNNEKVFDSDIQKNKFEYKTKKNSVPVSTSIREVLLRMGFPYFFPTYIQFNLPDNLDCISVPGIIKIDIEKDGFWWGHLNSLSFLQILLMGIEISYGGDVNKMKNITKSVLSKQLVISNEIRANLKKYTPIQDIKFNENINVYKTEKAITIENLKVDFKLNNEWIPWSQLSDGTKRLFYIITEITSRKDGLILVEEPELGVHPHQFNLIMDFLKEESENKQIIISTHSPQALNHLNEDELSHILVTSYDAKKGTQIKHLTTAQINKAKKYMKEVGFFSDYWMLSDLE